MSGAGLLRGLRQGEGEGVAIQWPRLARRRRLRGGVGVRPSAAKGRDADFASAKKRSEPKEASRSSRKSGRSKFAIIFP